jgi:hypothetical protein
MPTLDEMNAQVEQIARLREKEAEASAAKSVITKELEAAELKMMGMLQEGGLTNYRSPMGLVSVSFRTSVRTPKTPEDREKFFAFLRQRGLYDALITVNSQTLNSFYKDEFEQAKQRGDVAFEIPGIKEVTMTPNISFRRST